MRFINALIKQLEKLLDIFYYVVSEITMLLNNQVNCYGTELSLIMAFVRNKNLVEDSIRAV